MVVAQTTQLLPFPNWNFMMFYWFKCLLINKHIASTTIWNQLFHFMLWKTKCYLNLLASPLWPGWEPLGQFQCFILQGSWKNNALILKQYAVSCYCYFVKNVLESLKIFWIILCNPPFFLCKVFSFRKRKVVVLYIYCKRLRFTF